MYNLTVRGHDITNVTSIEDVSKIIHQYGIQNVQFALNMSMKDLTIERDTLNPGMGTYFKNLFIENNIQIAILSCYCNLIHPEKKERESILQIFESFIQNAKYFGASMVATETGSVIPGLGYSEENFLDSTFEDLVTVVDRLVKKGKEHNTLVAIEAGLNHPLYSVERTKQLVDLINNDYLGIILDPTNLITTENYENIVNIVEEAFQLYGKQIVGIQLKDFIIDGNQIKPVDFGRGIIPFEQILKIVNKNKPYCYIVLEETKDENIRLAKNKLDFL